MSEPESRAEEIRRKMKEQADKEAEEIAKKQPIHVEIDASGTVSEIEKLTREKAEAEAKLENRAKIEVGAEAIERLKAKADELGITYEEPKTLEDFESLAVTVKSVENELNRKAPSGTIPLSQQQVYGADSVPSDTQQLIDYAGSVRDLKFDSFEQMITVLKARSDSDVESKAFLEILTKRSLQSEKDAKTTHLEYEGGIKDMTKRKNLFKKKESP